MAEALQGGVAHHNRAGYRIAARPEQAIEDDGQLTRSGDWGSLAMDLLCNKFQRPLVPPLSGSKRR
jgi:hypothetical protein